MTQDEHIDPFDYIDKSDKYYDYYDTVVKRANGDVLIVRWHCDFLPGDPPYRLSMGIQEEIPLAGVMPDSRKHAERIAATLEGGDKPLHGKSWEYYREDAATQRGKAALIQPPEYKIHYFRDVIWKRADGEVVVLRTSCLVLSVKRKQVFIRSLPEEEISQIELTDEARKRVFSLAAHLVGGAQKSRCDFTWSDASREHDPSNYWVSLRDKDRIRMRQTTDVPRFASPAALLKNLAFSRDGATLLHSVQQQVFVWDVENARLRGVADGELFGIADDGKTFITRLMDQDWVKRDIAARSGEGRQTFLTDPIPEPQFTLWDAVRCEPLGFASISPDTYPLHQRFHGMADRYRHLIRLDDVFGVIPSRTIDLQTTIHEDAILENWLIAPDNQHLAIIYYVSGGGFDWNGGVCVRLDDGQEAYHFDGGRDGFPSYLFFSREHHWLMSPYGSTLNIYDLTTGNRTRIHELPSGFSVVCAHPVEMLLAETRFDSSISLRDMEQPDSAVRRIKLASQALEIEFHPNGERLAVALKSGGIEIRKVKTGRLAGKLQLDTPKNMP
ncbi:MAG TPA: WD40 repeat domain-containing protein [Aggregatilineales bacterium]|nr:WD40 repeat domain-containing protein [Anaerolineales bacterium]HRE48502.1 WD40 repeat domain-containing protein [Aggregatilineales bacterium]